MIKHKSAVAVMVISAVFTATFSQLSQAKDLPHPAADSDENQDYFKNLNDRFSYAYGADLAEKFKDEGLELNVELMAAAMKAAFAGGEMKMPPGEVIATLELYQKVFLKKKEEERAVIGEKNKAEGSSFLAENAKKDGVIVTKSGLQYKIIAEGEGGYKPKLDDEVLVQYRGRFIDGTEFDSTHKRNEPYSAKVKQLIQGWSEALQMMSKGAKWELYIPADIAYGEQGSGNDIGPNAVLIFEVELLDIEKQKG